jgi:hypothetical protein
VEDKKDPANVAASLLEFQSKLQRCTSQRELLFIAVNESYHVVRFDQAVLWQYDARSGILVRAVSGLVEITSESPYAQWLERVVRHFLHGEPAPVVTKSLSELPASIAEDGAEWAQEHLLHSVLVSPEGKKLGGLLMSRTEPFSEMDSAVAQWLASSVGFAIWGWERAHRPVRRWLERRSSKLLLAGALVALAALVFIPVRLNAIAPAEITPDRPIPITAPVEGIVDSIKVRPNEIVKADQLLVVLNETSTRNRLEVAKKGLDLAAADYRRTVNKAFFDEASRGDLNVLDARIKEKAAEVGYLSDLLGQMRIRAPQGGLAIFADAEEWRGRPVQPGERIMTIADPSLVAVTIYLPPVDAVELNAGAEVSLFLDVDPLSPLRATITQTSYEAIPQPDNSLAYLIKAQLEPGTPLPRIGLKGSAKIYSEKVALGYYLLRKPVLFLRKSVGF